MEEKQSLSYNQVSKLNAVLSTEMEINSHNNFPSLTVTPASLVRAVKASLIKQEINIKDIRMNGSAASYCICEDSDDHPQIHYNDIDLIFGVDIGEDSDFHVIKEAVMTALLDFLPEGISKSNITSQLMEETYVRKMVLVSNQKARWSLVSLGDSNSTSTTIEMKFVDKIRRRYEFTVDSFQILIDSYFEFNKCAKESPVSVSQMFFPSVHAISVYHDYEEALDHLNKRLIHTEAPEEIRGGGLLKYCSLRVNGFKPADDDKMAHLEPYMCSRFFIDFPTEEVQFAKIEKYVTSRFAQSEEGSRKGVEFLNILHSVVATRAKCLVESERRRTMGVIAYIQSMLTAPRQVPAAATDFFPPSPFHHIITGFHSNQFLNSAAPAALPNYYHFQFDSTPSALRHSPPPPPNQQYYQNTTSTTTSTSMKTGSSSFHNHHHHQQQHRNSSRQYQHHQYRPPPRMQSQWKFGGHSRSVGAVR